MGRSVNDRFIARFVNDGDDDDDERDETDDHMGGGTVEPIMFAVYVLEGRVHVKPPQGQIELSSRQVAINSTLVKADVFDYLGWMDQHEEPTLKLALDAGGQRTVTPGAPLKWTLTLESDSDTPVWLGAPRDVSQLFSLLINGQPAALAPDSAVFRLATRGPGGLIRRRVRK